jgi:hypothetical protein
MKWIDLVKQVKNDHPEAKGLKDILKIASPMWKKMKGGDSAKNLTNGGKSAKNRSRRGNRSRKTRKTRK